MRGWAWVCLLLAAPGCRGCDGASTGATADTPAPSGAADCDSRTTEKLGVPFSKLCPGDVPAGGPSFTPFWISAQPLNCSAGEHETLRCPYVAPLHHPAPGETRAPLSPPAIRATVLEASTAQGWCYMRFAGRLPTREERARAEVSLGLAAVVVEASAGDPLHFAFSRLAEWVTEGPCETPTVASCKVGMYPSGGRRPIPWDSMLSCSAAPLTGDAGALLDVGESCPAPGFDWAASQGKLPCAVRSSVARAPVLGFALTCKAPFPPGPHPADDLEKTAAVRCVMPGTMR